MSYWHPEFDEPKQQLTDEQVVFEGIGITTPDEEFPVFEVPFAHFYFGKGKDTRKFWPREKYPLFLCEGEGDTPFSYLNFEEKKG